MQFARRKNIGYLYAIEQGATQVYETDDDDELISTDPLNMPTFAAMEYIVYNASGGVSNTHFEMTCQTMRLVEGLNGLAEKYK